MTKELRELLAQLDTMKAEVRSLMTDNKVDEAEKKMAEVRSLQKKIDLQKQLDEGGEQRGGKPATENAEEDVVYRNAFMKGLRRRSLTGEEIELIEKRAMAEGVAEDGGLIVPQDISTKIRELMRARIDISQYVNIEPVTTLSGSRVIEKEATLTPFADITELTDLADMDNPKFVSVGYAVKSRGGILPLSNSLLQDSDQNLMRYVTRWIAKKSVRTRNKLILDLLATLAKKALADEVAIKKVLNVDLDPNLAMGAVILTNQDGFNFLDSLKDLQGRFLIQPDPTQPGRRMMFGKPVIVAPNTEIPTVATKAPVIIGNLSEFVTLFDRQNYEILSTNVGGKAFARNTTDVRVIERSDIKKIDDSAVVYGELTIPV